MLYAASPLKHFDASSSTRKDNFLNTKLTGRLTARGITVERQVVAWIVTALHCWEESQPLSVGRSLEIIQSDNQLKANAS